MTKVDLGVKRDCPECGARFYDLTKEPAHCPKCDHEFIPEALLKPRKPRAESPAPEKTDGEEKPEAETSLDEADEENKGAESKKKAALDEESDDSEDEIENEIKDLGIELDDDDDDADEESNDTLIDDDDDAEESVAAIIPKGDGDDM